MKRARTLVARAVVAALLLVALNAGIASADPGNGQSQDSTQGDGQPQQAAPPTSQTSLPQDPGIEYQSDQIPEDPGIS